MNAHATLVPVPGPPGQLQGELLREDAHEWVVRASIGANLDDALTRITRRSLDPAAGAVLREAVLGGQPLDESLPWELRRIFEGYRVRASLPAGWPLPAVLDAGLTAERLPYVTRAWVDGTPLSKGFAALVPELQDEVLVQVLDLMDQLHGAGVIVQDLKPDNTVLDATARLWLVDLESLRIARSGAIPCTHYTPKFAAPEQLRGRVSLPASDLYAFGRLVSELYVGQVPMRWAPTVAACLAEDPRQRPTAATAGRLGLLPDATVRVPEPEDTGSGAFVPGTQSLDPSLTLSVPPAVVATAVVQVEETGATEVVARPKGRWALRIVAGLAALGMVGFGVGFAKWTADRLAVEREARIAADRAADELTARVRDELREHKVVAAKNTDVELERVLGDARRAVELRRDADTLGLEALATVWSQRWHWRGAKWDAARFAVADTKSREALAAGETAEGVLARGLTAAAACRHAPRGPDTARWCGEALENLDRAAALGPGWLKVEAAWGAVMVLDTQVRRELDEADADEATRLAKEALARCDAARPTLAAAPVNGPELVEDCVWAAAAARDRDAWLAWTGWLLERRTDGVHAPPAVVGELVRSAAPECARIDTDAQGLPTAPGEWPDWCSGMAVRALRCAGMALDPEDPARLRRPGWCPKG